MSLFWFTISYIGINMQLKIDKITPWKFFDKGFTATIFVKNVITSILKLLYQPGGNCSGTN